MSKKRKRLDERQLNIFDMVMASAKPKEDACGSMRIIDELRNAINDALKCCPLSRHQVAGQMSHLLNEEISKATIDSWTAESKSDRHIPAEYLPAFCRTVKSNKPLEVLIGKSGLFALEGPEALRSEIHTLSEQIAKLRKGVREREQLLQLFSNAGE